MCHILPGTKPFRVKNPYGADTITTDLYSGLDGAAEFGCSESFLPDHAGSAHDQEFRNRYVVARLRISRYGKNFNFRATWYADVSQV